MDKYNEITNNVENELTDNFNKNLTLDNPSLKRKCSSDDDIIDISLVDNKLTVGIIDYKGKDYLNRCIQENILEVKKLMTKFDYYLFAVGYNNELIDFTFKDLNQTENETTYNFNECPDTIKFISFVLDKKNITPETDYCIYLIQPDKNGENTIVYNYNILEKVIIDDYIALFSIVRFEEEWMINSHY